MAAKPNHDITAYDRSCSGHMQYLIRRSGLAVVHNGAGYLEPHSSQVIVTQSSIAGNICIVIILGLTCLYILVPSRS